ncbi:unnamed protein product [Rhizophagus irregularis]|nr:unnamed protein product [Rhizophagus irregularis]
MPKVKRQRASYSIEQKKIVVAYATQHGRNAAGRHFEIDKTMVGRWIKASETWTSEINDKNMRVGSGRKAFYPEAEKELYNWVLDQRKKGLAVTFITIRISMNEILDRADMVALYGDLTTEFKATTGWLNAFMKRHNLTRRRRTKISQKLPEQLEEKLEEFYRTGNENNRFTVVLTCAADGTRLPPICIFKESGWMNVELMKRYIDYLNCMRSSNSQSRFPAMMVFDSFRGHLEESVKEKFNQSNIDLAVIPGGLTSKCQPLDVAINKPFKDNLRKEWHFWISNGGAGYTEAGNLRRAKISDVCGWVKRAWESISDDIIVYSFKKCGISNALDGSEDDAIYEEIDEFLREIENEREEEELEIVDMDDNDDSE